MQLTMSFSMEKVLADARVLVNRLKDHDSAADSLIAVTQTMYRRVDSMRQYQEDLNELNEIARHRPRSNLILGLIQENSQIRELQQENKELRGCLEEHQSALELIMSKYREQIFKLVMANKMDRENKDQPDGQQEVGDKVEKICEMAAIMQKAIRVDERTAIRDRERTAQLETENKTLRELLMISHHGSQEVAKLDRGVQANMGPVASLDSSGNQDSESQGAVTDDEDHHFVTNDMNASVIENKSFTFGAPEKASSPVGTWGQDTTGSGGSSDTSSHNESADRISLGDVAVNMPSGSKSNQEDNGPKNAESFSGDQGSQGENDTKDQEEETSPRNLIESSDKEMNLEENEQESTGKSGSDTENDSSNSEAVTVNASQSTDNSSSC